MTREEDLKEEGRVVVDEYVRELGDYTFGEESMVKMFVLGANYADKHPSKGLWDAKRVTEWIENNFSCSGHGFPLHYLHVSYQPEDIIRDLCKAMEE